MKLFGLAFASTLALMMAAPAGTARTTESTALADYVRARAADAVGMPELAAAHYAKVMAITPNDAVLATRAYRQAIMAGDRALAVKAVRVLDATGTMPPDARLLLLSEAVSARDWKAASAITDQVEKEDVFSFLVPPMRAWIAFGAKERDPLAKLDGPRGTSLGASYAAEHRALLQLAMGQEEAGLATVRSISLRGAGRSVPLQLATAAAIKDRSKALGQLDGDEQPLAAARALLEAGKPLPNAVKTPAEGIAALFARVAIDINRERVTPLALTLARIATFLAPDNAEAWLLTSEMLNASKQYDAALVALEGIKADDPFAEAALDSRVQLLVRKGDREAALVDALAASTRREPAPTDWSRVGDLYVALGRQADAATAYGKAIAIAEAAKLPPEQMWPLYLLQGGALEQSGDWPAGKAALEKARATGPDQAVVLNYLGYAQLERRENLDGAQKLIEQASRLRPDDAAITDSLGWLYYLRGNLPKAIETLERAVAGEPGEPTINEHLGDAYWSVGRRFEARYAWQAALVHADAADAQRINRKLDGGLRPEFAAP